MIRLDPSAVEPSNWIQQPVYHVYRMWMQVLSSYIERFCFFARLAVLVGTYDYSSYCLEFIYLCFSPCFIPIPVSRIVRRCPPFEIYHCTVGSSTWGNIAKNGLKCLKFNVRLFSVHAEEIERYEIKLLECETLIKLCSNGLWELLTLHVTRFFCLCAPSIRIMWLSCSLPCQHEFVSWKLHVNQTFIRGME